MSLMTNTYNFQWGALHTKLLNLFLAGNFHGKLNSSGPPKKVKSFSFARHITSMSSEFWDRVLMIKENQQMLKIHQMSYNENLALLQAGKKVQKQTGGLNLLYICMFKIWNEKIFLIWSISMSEYRIVAQLNGSLHSWTRQYVSFIS